MQNNIRKISTFKILCYAPALAILIGVDGYAAQYDPYTLYSNGLTEQGIVACGFLTPGASPPFGGADTSSGGDVTTQKNDTISGTELCKNTIYSIDNSITAAYAHGAYNSAASATAVLGTAPSACGGATTVGACLDKIYAGSSGSSGSAVPSSVVAGAINSYSALTSASTAVSVPYSVSYQASRVIYQGTAQGGGTGQTYTAATAKSSPSLCAPNEAWVTSLDILRKTQGYCQPLP